eukprot:3367380-Amphidinium_carterae.1
MIDLNSSSTIVEYLGQGRRFTIAFCRSHFFLVKETKRSRSTKRNRCWIVFGGAKSGDKPGLSSGHVSKASSSTQRRERGPSETKDGKRRRPYPFAGMTEKEVDQVQVKAARQMKEREQQYQAIIVAHGSFNPPHAGHIGMMRKARARLISAGYEVQAGIMAIAHRSWIWGKGDLSLSDACRAEAIDKLAADSGCSSWLHADARGVLFKSYWQMRPILLQQYPNTTVFGVWGSDSGRTFYEGPGICVFRRGYSGPKEDTAAQHYTIEEEEAHSHSSTKLRQAIFRKDFDAVASMTSNSLADMAKQWDIMDWSNKEIVEVEKAELAAQRGKTNSSISLDDIANNSVEHDNTVKTVIDVEAKTIPDDKNEHPPVLLHTPHHAQVIQCDRHEVEPRRALVPQEKAMPKKKSTARPQPDTDRPPLPRRRRAAAATAAQPPIEEEEAVSHNTATTGHRDQREPANQIAAGDHPTDEFAFSIARFDNVQEAFDLVAEPALVLHQRDFGAMSIRDEGMMHIRLGPPMACALTGFMTRAQAGPQSLPLHRIADSLGWMLLPGFLMSWHFAYLEVSIVRELVRDLLSRTMSMVRKQALLSFPAVTFVGIEMNYHTFQIYTRSEHTDDMEAIAKELQWLANSYIASTRREHDMHKIRICLHHASWPSEYSPNSTSDDDTRTTNHGGAGRAGLVSGGGGAVPYSLHHLVLAAFVTSDIGTAFFVSSLDAKMEQLSSHCHSWDVLDFDLFSAIEWTQELPPSCPLFTSSSGVLMWMLLCPVLTSICSSHVARLGQICPQFLSLMSAWFVPPPAPSLDSLCYETSHWLACSLRMMSSWPYCGKTLVDFVLGSVYNILRTWHVGTLLMSTAGTMRIWSGGAPHAMSQTSPCMLHGTEHRLANPEELRRRVAHHHSSANPRRRPQPLCWWTNESLLERTQAEDEVAEVRRLIVEWFPCTTYWKQHWCTPERRPSLCSEEEVIPPAHPLPQDAQAPSSRCILHGSAHCIANPDELQRGIARHYDLESPRILHQPICWWTDESELECLAAENDLAWVRHLIAGFFSSTASWKQHAYTPRRNVSIQSSLDEHEHAEAPTSPKLIEGGANHIAAFRTALRVLHPDCRSLQELIYCVEELTRKRLSPSSSTPPPLLTYINKADSLLGDWSQEHPLRRDFIRGAFLDLILLAEYHEAGITLIDDKGVHRLHMVDKAMLCLQLNPVEISYSAIGVCLACNRIVSASELTPELNVSGDSLQWCSDTQIMVANMLMDFPPAVRTAGVQTVQQGPQERSTQSLSSTIPWSSESASLRSQLSAHISDEMMKMRQHCEGEEEIKQDERSIIFGGAAGPFARRHALKLLPRCLHVETSRGHALDITYNGKLSSKSIIETYAKHKRVGRRYLRLHASHSSGFQRSMGMDSKRHLVATWTGFKITVTNQRYSILKSTDPHSAEAHEELWHSMNQEFAAQTEARDAVTSGILHHNADIMLADNDDNGDDDATLQLSDELDRQEADLEQMEQETSSKERVVRLAISFLGHAKVPARWTLKEVHSWLWKVHRLDPAGAKIFIARKKVTAAKPTGIVSGGAGSRKLRVPRETVSQAALATVIRDLPSCRAGLLIEHALVKKMIEWDPKLGRTLFQAKTAGERLKLLARTMHTNGLSDMARALMKDSLRMNDPDGHTPSETDVAKCLVPNSVTKPAEMETAPMEDDAVQQAAPVAGRRPKLVLHDEVINRLTALEQWAHEIDSVAHAAKGKVTTGCSLECLTRISKLESSASQALMDDLPPTQTYGSQDLATQDPYMDPHLPHVKKRGRPRASSVTGELGGDTASQMQQQTQQFNKLEAWCHQMVAKLESRMDALARERRPEAGAQQNHTTAISTDLENKLYQHDIAIAELASLNPRSSCMKKTQESTVPNFDHQATSDKSLTLEQEIGKLWSLYHRLQRRLDERGLLPEVSVIFPGDSSLHAKQQGPTAPQGWETQLGIEQARVQHIVDTLTLVQKQTKGLEMITNTIWPWLTSVAAKVQELGPAVHQMWQQSRLLAPMPPLYAAAPAMPWMNATTLWPAAATMTGQSSVPWMGQRPPPPPPQRAQ